MSWPMEIKARAESITLRMVLSTFIGYLAIFTLGATRYLV